jgi:hypothetical protein
LATESWLVDILTSVASCGALNGGKSFQSSRGLRGRRISRFNVSHAHRGGGGGGVEPWKREKDRLIEI